MGRRASLPTREEAFTDLPALPSTTTGATKDFRFTAEDNKDSMGTFRNQWEEDTKPLSLLSTEPPPSRDPSSHLFTHTAEETWGPSDLCMADSTDPRTDNNYPWDRPLRRYSRT